MKAAAFYLVSLSVLAACSSETTTRSSNLELTLPAASAQLQKFSMAIAEEAAKHQLQVRGPSVRPGRTGDNYAYTFKGDAGFEVALATEDDKLVVDFYCANGSQGAVAIQQLGKHAAHMFGALSQLGPGTVVFYPDQARGRDLSAADRNNFGAFVEKTATCRRS